MTLIPLNELVIDALVTKLDAGLPAALDQINAEDDKGIFLDAVEPVLDYVPPPGSLNRFPMVCVTDGPSALADDVGWGATGHHQLTIVTFVMHSDQRTLAIMLRRYTRAVCSVAIEGRSIGAGPGKAWGMLPPTIKPGPTLGREENPREWMSYTGIALTVYDEQDAP